MATQIEQIQRACEIIQANPEERHTLGVLAGRVGLSRFHFQRAFTQVVGISPRAFAEACRLGQVKTALRKGERVTPALYDAGYGSSSRLYERADAALGMTPATYRRGAPGVEIDFTIADSPLGRLLLAATTRGVCRVMIGDSDRALEKDLREEYPNAAVRRNDHILSVQVRTLLEHLQGKIATRRAAARRACHRVSMACLAASPGHPVRRDAHVSARWRPPSASRPRRVRSPAPARPTPSRSSSRAIASFALTGPWADTDGGSRASRRC